jgi:hypothetical protein
MEARVTAYSQADRLREGMEKAAVRHGQEIRADLPGIKVIASARKWFAARDTGKGEVLFCTMGPVRVREVTTPGDGRPLPTTVTLEGLVVPGSGAYDLLNTLVRSNGDLQLIVDDATRVVPAGRERQAVTEGELVW